MTSTVYIETTIVSYLTARRSRDLIVAAHQQLTEDWWEGRRKDFELFISQSVLLEAGAGDPEAAQRRLTALAGIDMLDITSEVEELARSLVLAGIVPARAAEDALHISIATVHGIDFLLTWNCRHIANAEVRSKLRLHLAVQGLELPVICTPEELRGA